MLFFSPHWELFHLFLVLYPIEMVLLLRLVVLHRFLPFIFDFVETVLLLLLVLFFLLLLLFGFLETILLLVLCFPLLLIFDLVEAVLLLLSLLDCVFQLVAKAILLLLALPLLLCVICLLLLTTSCILPASRPLIVGMRSDITGLNCRLSPLGLAFLIFLTHDTE